MPLALARIAGLFMPARPTHAGSTPMLPVAGALAVSLDASFSPFPIDLP